MNNRIAVPSTRGYRESVDVHCLSCRKVVRSRVNYTPGTKTLLIGLCLLPFGFCWLPCVIPGCKDAVHSCTKCGHHLGTTEFDI